MSSYQALDTLMSGYLGPAGSYVTGTEDVSEALTYYFEHQPAHIKQELLENIEAFYADQDNINEAFERRYRHSDYDGSPQEFLSTVEARTRHDLGLQPAIAAVTTANQIVPGKTYQIRVSDNGMLGGIKRWLGYAEIGRAVMTQAAVSIGDVVEVAVAKGGNEITLNGRKRRVLNRAIRRKLNEADREPKPEKNRGQYAMEAGIEAVNLCRPNRCCNGLQGASSYTENVLFYLYALSQMQPAEKLDKSGRRMKAIDQHHRI